MRIYRLTRLAIALLSALESKTFGDLSRGELERHIEEGTIFELLDRRIERRVALTTLKPVDRLKLALEWQSLMGCAEFFEADDRRGGVLQLVGYLLEGIARRAQDARYRLSSETCGAAVPEHDMP